jgi:DNA gyrase/topoisomerase IV subunit B
VRAQINEITTILGLNHERTYSDAEATDAEQSGEVASDGLRYGKVMLMTDQDHDGASSYQPPTTTCFFL